MPRRRPSRSSTARSAPTKASGQSFRRWPEWTTRTRRSGRIRPQQARGAAVSSQGVPPPDVSRGARDPQNYNLWGGSRPHRCSYLQLEERKQGLLRPGGALLDALARRLLRCEGYAALDEDAGQMDLVRSQLAHLDDLLGLDDRQPAGHRRDRIE